MNGSFELWLFTVALGASALGGMLGMASGIFIVPILTVFGHVNIHIAIAAGIASVIACSCAGAAPMLKARLTNVRLAIVLEIATTLGALTGVVLSGLVSAPILCMVFATILVLSAWQMLTRRRDPPANIPARRPRSWTGLNLDSTYPDRALGQEVDYRVDRLPLGMGLMYGAGLISALLGIGSGVLKIPAMDTALRLPIKVSSATDADRVLTDTRHSTYCSRSAGPRHHRAQRRGRQPFSTPPLLDSGDRGRQLAERGCVGAIG